MCIDIISIICLSCFLDSGHYFQDFEGTAENNEDAPRKTSVRPQCGRQSLSIAWKPAILYKADLSKKHGVVYGLYSLKRFPKVGYAVVVALVYVNHSRCCRCEKFLLRIGLKHLNVRG